MRHPEDYQYEIDTTEVTEVWRRGSVVGSWLLDLTAEALLASPDLEEFSGRVSDSGEGRWTSIAAIDEGVPAPVLTTALYSRFASRGLDNYANRVLSAMRKGFGGHAEKAAKRCDRATDPIEREKQLAAEAAAQLVQDGMLVGLGTGSTAAYLLPPLAARGLDITCVATSPATSQAARALGIDVVSFAGVEAPTRLDMTIDGADQVDPAGWLIKGGGAAHTREKAVAAAADRFIVIVSSNKVVDRLEPPVPLELAEFGLASTFERVQPARLRDVPHSPDGGVIADYLAEFDDPEVLATWLSTQPGVVEHGLFPPSMVAEVLIGRDQAVERITPPSAKL